MSDESGSVDALGQPVDDAVEGTLGRDDVPDREELAAALEAVAEDGVVTSDGVDDGLAHVAEVVSTPETRVEITAVALDEAREAAPADRPVVRTRLADFEAQLAAVEERTGELGDELGRLVDLWEDEGDALAVAVGIHELTEDADRCQGRADELTDDVEEFQAWLEEPGRRYAELDEDVDALDAAIDQLAEAVDSLAAARGAADDLTEEIAAGWFDAALRYRGLDLMVADLRWELSELREWADVEDGDDAPTPGGIEARLDGLDERRAEVARGLDELAGVGLLSRFSNRLGAVNRDLEEVEPPVDWAAVEATLDEHRAEVEGLG